MELDGQQVMQNIVYRFFSKAQQKICRTSFIRRKRKTHLQEEPYRHSNTIKFKIKDKTSNDARDNVSGGSLVK
jgi:hypothetical protein